MEPTYMGELKEVEPDDMHIVGSTVWIAAVGVFEEGKFIISNADHSITNTEEAEAVKDDLEEWSKRFNSADIFAFVYDDSANEERFMGDFHPWAQSSGARKIS